MLHGADKLANFKKIDGWKVNIIGFTVNIFAISQCQTTNYYLPTVIRGDTSPMIPSVCVCMCPSGGGLLLRDLEEAMALFAFHA